MFLINTMLLLIANASGTPPITIRWLWIRNGTSINKYDNVNTITISNAKDGDVVTCRANNNIGFDEENTTIIIPKGNYSKTIFAMYKATINTTVVSHP